jgi:hypothetical protein
MQILNNTDMMVVIMLQQGHSYNKAILLRQQDVETISSLVVDKESIHLASSLRKIGSRLVRLVASNANAS